MKTPVQTGKKVAKTLSIYYAIAVAIFAGFSLKAVLEGRTTHPTIPPGSINDWAAASLFLLAYIPIFYGIGFGLGWLFRKTLNAILSRLNQNS